ncbi:Hypothetical predicted protein [Mytilus galloprovincialis]|uniref:Uncharacterized protein n=1 Tax=Mytilus galloprovincialis TaxID=29158 RepID=A0A8B6G5P9_MYTGA|nr:Hypothetical predicted protein [Mytilus galloprovincialis]
MKTNVHDIQDVDIVNTKLERLISNSLSLVRNDNINVRNYRYYHTDGVHLSISGNFELVRAIKSHMNPVLGLKDYHNNYNQSENIHQLTTPRKNHLPPQHTMPNRLFSPANFEHSFYDRPNANAFREQRPLVPPESSQPNWFRDRELIMRLLNI